MNSVNGLKANLLLYLEIKQLICLCKCKLAKLLKKQLMCQLRVRLPLLSAQVSVEMVEMTAVKNVS